MCCRQVQAAVLLGKEHRHSRNQKCARKPLYDRFQERVEVGFRTEAAAKLNQRLAVIVAVTIENAVNPALDSTLQGLEDGGNEQNRESEPPLANRFGHVHVRLLSG